ncbi:DUF5777 family beta-barrel protein [uncultured Imperialibacter sp.]|uniref:DUF5777 family beta-barrel protein n=1 Tax=uncultured Imperialibacter sp. TaxID=1672639 RepID=UPI0030D92B85|tara:strand:- start:44683 stop:45582 length:900 start_codon:yes stop_codon:yes gene_type:complete
MKILSIFTLLVAFAIAPSLAQDLDDLLNSMESETIDYTTATFKSSRVINLHSPERVAPGAMEFRISHRFGPLNGGAYNLWGLDQSSVRFGFDFGLTKWLMVGVGRSTYEKTYDGFVKAAILRQSTGKKVMPLSAVWVSNMSVNGLRWEFPDRTNYFSSRIAFVHQLVLARKFSDRFSAEVVPTWVHFNLVEGTADLNYIPAIGFGGRIKLSRRTALNGEYILRVADKNAPNVANYNDSFSIGFDIETGGHVFQLHLTNSLAMMEKGFIAENTDTWGNGGIHFGFNVTREFTLSKKSRME